MAEATFDAIHRAPSTVDEMHWIRSNLDLLTLMALLAALIVAIWQSVISRRATIGQNFLTILQELSSYEMRKRRERVLSLPPDQKNSVESWSSPFRDDVEEVGKSFETLAFMAKKNVVPKGMAVEFFGATAIRCFDVVDELIQWRIHNQGWKTLWGNYQWLVEEAHKKDFGTPPLSVPWEVGDTQAGFEGAEPHRSVATYESSTAFPDD
jgi:hypothetical protein